MGLMYGSPEEIQSSGCRRGNSSGCGLFSLRDDCHKLYKGNADPISNLFLLTPPKAAVFSQAEKG